MRQTATDLNLITFVQLVERVYESCGRNLDSAIKSLNGLRLNSNEHISPSPESAGHAEGAAAAAAAVAATSSGNCGVSSDGTLKSVSIRYT